MTKRFLPLSVGFGLAAVTLLTLVMMAQGVPGAGGDANDGAVPSPCRASDALPDPSKPVIDCVAPPNTFDVTSFYSADSSAEAKAAAGPTWDAWAWASFAAMNWPALTDASLPTGYVRGVPDPQKSFAGAQSDDVLVWETFKEKRELFQPTDTTGPSKITQNSLWQDVTFADQQQPVSSSNPGGIDPCSPREAKELAALGDGHHRFFSQGGKLPSRPDGVTAGSNTGSNDEENTFDETIEVASPALEEASVLCAGYDDTTNPTQTECENDIFPDSDVNARTPVGPRVWNGNPKDLDSARPVFFEVKVNYDFWDYILQQSFFLDANASAAATSSDIDQHPKLPFRTSAPTGPGRSPNAVFGYQAEDVAQAYGDLSDPNRLPGIGSVQAKAAWLKLDGEDPSKYHTTMGVFYKTKPDAPPKFPDSEALKYTCYEVDQFGLLGLHIIQRVHAQPFDRDNPSLFAHGGTFIFATWEHVGLGDVGDETGYYYANYLAFDSPLPQGTFPPYTFDVMTTPFPNFAKAAGGAIPVVREKPYPLDTTTAVTEAVWSQLPAGSLWTNYRLIGTQFVVVDSEDESLTYNQPYFLANLVVETNDGLQHFHGLPPGVSPTPYYQAKTSIGVGTGPDFAPDSPNVIFNRELSQPFNMGGCMGCHGVAQLDGYNFSFVFKDGQAGSGLDTQQHFAVAGGQLP